MKKIMFNSDIGLEYEVLRGKKTVTRRVVPENALEDGIADAGKHARYKVGETVAVAQSYRKVADYMTKNGMLESMLEPGTILFREEYTGFGWDNKMYVKAELMPHRIRITKVSTEWLQDIIDEDCMKEGVFEVGLFSEKKHYTYIGSKKWFDTPREAFADIIEKTCSKGLWDENPLVYRYEFELLS